MNIRQNFKKLLQKLKEIVGNIRAIFVLKYNKTNMKVGQSIRNEPAILVSHGEVIDIDVGVLKENKEKNILEGIDQQSSKSDSAMICIQIMEDERLLSRNESQDYKIGFLESADVINSEAKNKVEMYGTESLVSLPYLFTTKKDNAFKRITIKKERVSQNNDSLEFKPATYAVETEVASGLLSDTRDIKDGRIIGVKSIRSMSLPYLSTKEDSDIRLVIRSSSEIQVHASLIPKFNKSQLGPKSRISNLEFASKIPIPKETFTYRGSDDGETFEETLAKIKAKEPRDTNVKIDEILVDCPAFDSLIEEEHDSRVELNDKLDSESEGSVVPRTKKSILPKLPPIQFKGQGPVIEILEIVQSPLLLHPEEYESTEISAGESDDASEIEFNLMESTAHVSTDLSLNLWKYTMINNICSHLNPNKMDENEIELFDFTLSNLSNTLDKLTHGNVFK